MNLKIGSGKLIITEGEPGQHYLARLEIWHIDTAGDRYKLADTNYIIQGVQD